MLLFCLKADHESHTFMKAQWTWSNALKRSLDSCHVIWMVQVKSCTGIFPQDSIHSTDHHTCTRWVEVIDDLWDQMSLLINFENPTRKFSLMWFRSVVVFKLFQLAVHPQPWTTNQVPFWHPVITNPHQVKTKQTNKNSTFPSIVPFTSCLFNCTYYNLFSLGLISLIPTPGTINKKAKSRPVDKDGHNRNRLSHTSAPMYFPKSKRPVSSDLDGVGATNRLPGGQQPVPRRQRSLYGKGKSTNTAQERPSRHTHNMPNVNKCTKTKKAFFIFLSFTGGRITASLTSVHILETNQEITSQNCERAEICRFEMSPTLILRWWWNNDKWNLRTLCLVSCSFFSLLLKKKTTKTLLMWYSDNSAAENIFPLFIIKLQCKFWCDLC